MKITFRESFSRDLSKIEDRSLLGRVKQIIDSVEAAEDLQQISNVKRITGSSNLYRIRVGDYRLGIAVEEGAVEFVRCLHRREIYRYFR